MSWLKVEYATPDKTEMFAVASRLERDRDVVFARWFRLWRWADENVGADGMARGVTLSGLSDIAGIPGFAEAFAAEGWLSASPKGVLFKDFWKHNGKSGKVRAQTAARQKAKRDAENVTEKSRKERDKSVTRPDQTRPDKNLDGKPAEGGSPFRSGLAGLDGLTPLDAMHRLGVNGPNAVALADRLTTEDIRAEAEAIAGDATVKQPSRALAARLMDRAGIGRKRKGGNTTTLDAETSKLVNTINRKRGRQ